jgi:hypothetical protein
MSERGAPGSAGSNRGPIELTSDDLRDIENAASQVTVLGARYPAHLEQMTGR